MNKIRALMVMYQEMHNLSIRDFAKEIGIEHTVLHRFISGNEITTAKFAKVMAWLMED